MDPQVFFFLFSVFVLFLKEDSVFRRGLFPALVANMMVGEVEVKERPRPSPDYLMQLLNEKKLMTSLPNLCGIFTHLERLLDEGKRRAVSVWETLGKSVTAARSGPGTASVGDSAAEQYSIHPTLLSVADIVPILTSPSISRRTQNSSVSQC